MIIALLIHVITSKTIYFIPHSHDDVGWLDTYKGIYNYGPGVRNIITSYFNALLKSETRKFV
jgi:alpha-mannosidase/lysosomal alpha-mannosidase